jgi:hypothetical protein
MIAAEIRNKPFIHQLWRDGPPIMAVNEFGLLLPGRDALYCFEEDFDGARGSLLSAANQTGWHEDADGSPTSLALVADGHMGVGLMKPGGTATNNVHYHWGLNTTVHEPFTMSATKRLWLTARFKIEDADKNLLIFGLHESQDDPWATEPNDQFLFRVPSSDGALQFAGGTSNSAEKTISLGTLADDTWYRALAFYDGGGTVRSWLWSDSGYLAEGRCDFGSTIIPDTPMSVAIGVEAVDTGADDFQLDFIKVYAER